MSEEDDRRAWEVWASQNPEQAEEQRRKAESREAEERRKAESRVGVEPLAAPTPGTAIAANVTIDALFTAVLGTRSADLVAAGTPTYSWGTGNQIIAQWPALQVGSSPAVPNFSAMWATFHARSDTARGSSIAQ